MLLINACTANDVVSRLSAEMSCMPTVGIAVDVTHVDTGFSHAGIGVVLG